MGGLIILSGVIVPTLLWSRLDNAFVILALFSIVWMGIVGFLDDYLKVKRKMSKGLVAKYKLVGQILLGCIIGTSLYVFSVKDQHAMVTLIPFFKNYAFNYSTWYVYIPMVALVITATSNAVNLTDGLDGLAIGLVAIACGTYAIICYILGRVTTAEYLNVFYIPGCGELTVFSLSIVGASLGFLWYNFHPAKVFMGDTGALPLGGLLGLLAVVARQELLLVIVGGVFVVEAVSVILQVGSYKWRRQRVFLCAPLHHHFQLNGVAENKIVVRFWIASALCALLGVASLKLSVNDPPQAPIPIPVTAAKTPTLTH